MNEITPAGSGSEIVAAVFEFHGLSIPFVIIDGEVLVRVRDLGRALEYSGDGDGLRKTIRSSWGRKLREGVELRLMTGEQARRVETALSTSDSRPNVTRFGGRTLMVTDSGMYMILAMSRQEKATEFQRWVTGTVIPNIARTGRHEEPSAVTSVEADTPDGIEGWVDPILLAQERRRTSQFTMETLKWGVEYGVYSKEDAGVVIRVAMEHALGKSLEVSAPEPNEAYTSSTLEDEIGVTAQSIGAAAKRLIKRGFPLRGKGAHKYGRGWQEKRPGGGTRDWIYEYNREAVRLILAELLEHRPKSPALQRQMAEDFSVDETMAGLFSTLAAAA